MKAKRNNSNLNIIRRIFTYSKPHRKFLWLSLVFYFISSVLLALIPLIIGLTIDCIIGQGNVNFSLLIKNIIYLLLCVVFGCLLDWLATVFENRLSYGTAKQIRKDVFDKFLNVPFSYLDRNSRGDFVSRMIKDIENITDGFLEGLTTVFSGVVSIVFNTIFMFKLNWILAIIVIVCSPLSILITMYIAKKSKKLYKAHAKATGNVSDFVEEMIGNQKVIKAFQYEDRAIEKFEQINDEMYSSGVNSHFYGNISNPSTRFINGVIYLVVGTIGSLMAIKGKVSVGVISSFLSYANQYAKPFNEISSVISDVQTAIASSERILEILDSKNEISDKDLPDIVGCKGDIKIENMSFSYSPSKRLIENFNLDVKPGQKVAIVGPTGCGKTTFINLLMRFYDVKEGDIKLSNQSINEVTRKSLREQFGMVLQETWLFSGTIKDNIAYGKQDATMEEIIEAAKMSGAHYFIERMENGYNTVINETGDNISAGQKQLICITRIMLLKPKILILDEATSNIDTRAEMQIQYAFSKLMENRTAFIVAHRLSTIVGSDIILVMNKGHIIEQGTHRELLDKKGFYYYLYNSQFNVI